MNTITLISYVTAGLTVVLMALTVVIVMLNTVSGKRIARTEFLRSKMLPILQDYLADTTSEAAVIQELERDREMALECLVETASSLPVSQRSRLHFFFDFFGFTQTLMDQVCDRNWSVCIRAATQLGFTGKRECVPLLLKALYDDMLDVRLAAARALAQLGVGEAVEPIIRSLALPGDLPQQSTAEILYEMGQPAVDPLLEFLRGKNNRKEDAAALAVAVRALGLLKADHSAPEIIALLEHPDTEVRLNSARTLGHIGSPVVIKPLLQRLQDPVWEVRSIAVKALGYLGYPLAIPVINQALEDTAWWVRYNAAEALFRLGEAGISVLKHAMAVSPDRFARDISRQILEEHRVITAPTGETIL